MVRPVTYTEKLDPEELRSIFGTPKHAYVQLRLDSYLRYAEFYRLWATGECSQRTKTFVGSAIREWIVQNTKEGLVRPLDLRLGRDTVELLAYAAGVADE